MTNNSKDLTICLAAAGRRVHLMNTLKADALVLGVKTRFLALDQNPELSSVCQIADVTEKVPLCSDSSYIDAVISACCHHGASMVIPTVDLDLQAFADSCDKMISQGVTPLVSLSSAVKIARNKQLTVAVLAAGGVAVPFTVPLAVALSSPADVTFPAIIKPLDGSSSKGIYYLTSWADLPSPSPEAHNTLFQERCTGAEYTVNAYVDRSGVLRCAVPHRRLEVRGGEVSKARTERRADLTAIAYKIVAAIPGLRGPFCFQAILTNSGPKVFEINARFGGGYPLAHAAGATFGKWLIEEALGLPCTAHDEWQDGLLMLRYDSAVFTKS